MQTHLTLLQGMETQSNTVNQIERSIFHLVCNITFVVAPATEAEPRALFLNSKQTTIVQLTLEEMGHP
jgi:hypothetical protein